MKKLIKVTIAFILLLPTGCNNPKNKQAEIKITSSNAEALTHGFTLLENNCFSCHNVDPKAKNKIAPDMKLVKEAYLKNNESLEDFTRTLTSHVQNPSEENSKMPEAIKKFGLMPKMLFTDAQLKDVAAYLFETNIEADNWYENQYQNEQKKHLAKANKNISPKEKGLEYALKTKSILGKNLLGAIKAKGTIGALSFCNENAFHLTDSVASQIDGVEIKRASDLYRNPANKATVNELTYIENTKNLLMHGEEITPQIQEIKGEMVGYYPITINKMCLQCHGKLTDEIKPNTYSKIKELYPDDLAVGYSTDELRGIWVVTMPKE